MDKLFSSVHPQPNAEDRACAEKLMAVCIRGVIETDWNEAAKMAASNATGREVYVRSGKWSWVENEKGVKRTIYIMLNK